VVKLLSKQIKLKAEKQRAKGEGIKVFRFGIEEINPMNQVADNCPLKSGSWLLTTGYLGS
jgi:hypothetical protein